MRAYTSEWSAKALKINFNQKQWRQDFGVFVAKKLEWNSETFVSRPHFIDENKKVKQFYVRNKRFYVYVSYEDKNKVLKTDDNKIAIEYLEGRKI